MSNLPVRTGRTRRLVARLVARRKDLGWSQERLANELVDRAAMVAEEFDEEPLWVTVSNSYVSRLERMFHDNAGPVEKRTRLTLSMAAYGMWARVLGLRLFVDIVPENSTGTHVFMEERDAALARRIRALPEDQRRTVEALVDQFWRLNPDMDE